MSLGEILDRVLEERKGRLDESGIRLTERPAGEEIPVEAQEDRIGEAVGHLVDTAVSALALGRDRRLAVRTRKVNDGAIIEVEFPGADLPGTSPADLFGAYHSGEDRRALGLVKCQKLLEGGGCRAYIASGPRNAVRYRIEVPRRPARTAPGSAPPMGPVTP